MPRCGGKLVGAGSTGYNCFASIQGTCVGFRIIDQYAEAQACQILDEVLADVVIPEHFERAVGEQTASAQATRRALLEAELRDLAAQDERVANAIAADVITLEAAKKTTQANRARRATIDAELRLLGREQDAYERAVHYVHLARARGIGALVMEMPINEKRQLFATAFTSITLDGQGRGRWRTRSIAGYELSDSLNTFNVQRASACASQDQGIGWLGNILPAIR